jgi:hypothetical protein
MDPWQFANTYSNYSMKYMNYDSPEDVPSVIKTSSE